MVQNKVNGVPFEAHFAKDMPQLRQLEDYSGVDGFVWKVDPLYQINSGHEWLIQVS